MMPMHEVRRRVLGVWTEWESEINWTTEGITRLVAFLVEGAAQRTDLTFRLVVTSINYQAARNMLSHLDAKEGEHWTVHSLPSTSVDDAVMASECKVPPAAEVPQPSRGFEQPLTTLTEAPTAAAKPNVRLRWLLRLGPSTMRAVLVATCLIALPLQIIRVLLRPIWRFFWSYGLSAVPVQLSILAASVRDPVIGACALGMRLRHAPLGFAALGLTLQRWSELNTPPPEDVETPPPPIPQFDDTFSATPPPEDVDAPPRTPQLDNALPSIARVKDDHTAPSQQPTELASQVDFANAEVNVDGWLLIRSDCVQGLQLKRPRVALFPDALPIEFAASYNPEEWVGKNDWSCWRHDTQLTLSCTESIIAFSAHVAKRHLVELFGVNENRISVIRHAPVDLSADLPFLASNRKQTPESRRDAANCLRLHASKCGWSYLAGFPFEDINYIAVSTQDRPTKNLSLVVDSVVRLIRRDYYDIKMFMTTVLDEVGAPGCLLPAALLDANLQLDAVSMPGLPKAVHSAFYHCAAVTVHPSLFEGGDTVFPFSESVSVGTPCLMGRGPHTEEMLESYPELDRWVFDPYDADGLARLIRDTIADRDNVLTEQLKSYARMRRRTWALVAGEYADAIIGSSGPARDLGVCP
jgi:glycosyltransferase involved in cell wall biosynthesis